MILLTGTTSTDVSEAVSDTVSDTVADTVQNTNEFFNYMNQQIPTLITFAIHVVLAIVVFMIGSKVIKWIRKIVGRSLERSTVDKGVEQFVDSMLKFVLYALLLFSIATKFGLESSSVAALIASAGVAIGLALQGSLSNFAGGVLILLLKPFKVGDYIIEDSNKNEGTVTEIQIFYTKLKTIDNRIIVLPNGTLSNNSLTNVTASNMRRMDLRIPVSYKSDIKKVKDVLENLVKKEPDILMEPAPIVHVDELGDHAVIMGVKAYIATEKYWNVRWGFIEQIKITFDEEGIEIPYQQLDVYVKKEM